jgi:hypothetical protein
MKASETVTCCFCGITLPEAIAVLMNVYPTSERDESQSLFAHRHCLAERLRPEVPKHPALEENV